MNNQTKIRWYRYVDCHTEWGSTIQLREFPVEKETPCGVKLRIYGGTYRQVLHNSTKKYASPTIEEAQANYIARKKKHVKILTAHLKAAERHLWLAEDNQWHGEYMSSFGFDAKKLKGKDSEAI